MRTNPSGSVSRSHSSLASPGTGSRPMPLFRPSATAPYVCRSHAVCAAGRLSYQAWDSATGLPAASSATPLSAKLATAMAPSRWASSNPATASLMAAAVACHSASASNSAAPGPTETIGVGRAPAATTSPSRAKIIAFTELVPRSTPQISGSPAPAAIPSNRFGFRLKDDLGNHEIVVQATRRLDLFLRQDVMISLHRLGR